MIVKESILHVKLVDRLGTRSNKAEDDVYGGRLDRTAHMVAGLTTELNVSS
jgi:hypothetical protein